MRTAWFGKFCASCADAPPSAASSAMPASSAALMIAPQCASSACAEPSVAGHVLHLRRIAHLPCGGAASHADRVCPPWRAAAGIGDNASTTMREDADARADRTLMSLVALPAFANDDIVLRGMGSFHIGGRIAEVSGKEVRADPAPARRPAHQARSERPVHGRADVRAVLPAEEPQGQISAADVAWRRADRRHLRVDAGRPRWLAQLLRPQGLGRLQLRCGRARALGLCQRRTCGPTRRSSSPIRIPYERFRIGEGEGSWNADPAKRKLYPGSAFPAEAYENYMRQSVPRWLWHRQGDRRRLSRAGRQGVPVRDAAAQPGRHVRLPGRRAAARQDQGASWRSRPPRPAGSRMRRSSRTCRCCRSSATMSTSIRAGRPSRRPTWPMARRSRPPAAVPSGSTFPTSASRAIRTC